jgi:aminoglycoside phosphotransferase (APT) family kinase protein
MASTFMRQRHDRFETPEETVFGLVRDATGKTPQWRRKIVAGNANEVYRVATDDGESVFVRVRHFGEHSLEQEEWAMEQARRAGVPIPAVHAVATLRLVGEELEAMVLAEAEGSPLSSLIGRLDKRDLTTALGGAGATLRALHSVRAEGFYHRHKDGRWDFPDWPSIAASMVEGRSGERDEIRAAGFGKRDIEFMLAMLARYGEEFPCSQPVLCHGDYVPDHIFVGDDLRVSAVIDFGMFQGGAPIIDFTHDVAHPGFYIDYLREGYGGVWATSHTFEQELALSSLNNQIGHLAHNLRIGNAAEAARVRDALAETVATLRRLG